MSYRLTIAAAAAVILASCSEFALISGSAWLVAASGAVLVVALAGTLTRLPALHAAIGGTVLAGLAAVPLLTAGSPWTVAGWVAIVACCAAGASRLRLFRAIAYALTYLAALLLYANLLLAERQSMAAVVPTARSLRQLSRLATSGFALIKDSPPVRETHGLLLLAVAGIGLIAICVDLLAVRLRRPAIAGLPLLVLFLTPIASTATVSGLGGGVAFSLAAIGYLAILSADGRSRLRGWGRLVTVWHSADDDRVGSADVAALAATGRRIGVAAVCVAVAAPLLLPTLNLHRLFGGGGGHAYSATVSLPDPMVQLHGLLARTTPEPVLSYRTSVPHPDYLQLYVDNYEPLVGAWTLIQPSANSSATVPVLPQPPGLAPGVPELSARTDVTLGQITNGYAAPVMFLPVPYWPVQLRIIGQWRLAAGTSMIYSTGPGAVAAASGLRYTVFSAQANPPLALLEQAQRPPAAIAREYLGYRSSVTGALTALAKRITRRAPDQFLKAVALEKWFQSGLFSYSLQVRVKNTPQGLLAFLTRDRRGYCQQFAFAMAVLARLIGIPSRIAVGYTAGAEHHGTWQVSTADAHAWPELYFDGIGWLRFEPTPSGAVGQATAVQPTYVTQAPSRGTQPGGQLPNGNAGGGPQSHPTNPAVNSHVHFPGEVPGRVVGLGSGGSRGALLAVEIALVILAVLGAVPATVRAVMRVRRWRGAADDSAMADAALLELCADLDDFEIPRLVSDSPRALAARVRSHTEGDESAHEAVGRIAAVVEQTYYGREPAAADAIRADVKIVRRGLARAAGWRARSRATLFPPSAIAPARTAVLGAAGTVTGWVPAPGTE
jgi:transglutaminase-like putative cysteine protease